MCDALRNRRQLMIYSYFYVPDVLPPTPVFIFFSLATRRRIIYIPIQPIDAVLSLIVPPPPPYTPPHKQWVQRTQLILQLSACFSYSFFLSLSLSACFFFKSCVCAFCYSSPFVDLVFFFYTYCTSLAKLLRDCYAPLSWFFILFFFVNNGVFFCWERNDELHFDWTFQLLRTLLMPQI